jgi:hypothetical protein
MAKAGCVVGMCLLLCGGAWLRGGRPRWTVRLCRKAICGCYNRHSRHIPPEVNGNCRLTLIFWRSTISVGNLVAHGSGGTALS